MAGETTPDNSGQITSMLKKSLGALTSQVTGGTISDSDVAKIADDIKTSISAGVMKSATQTPKQETPQPNEQSFKKVAMKKNTPNTTSSTSSTAPPQITPQDTAQATQQYQQAPGANMQQKIQSMKAASSHKIQAASRTITPQKQQPKKLVNKETLRTATQPAPGLSRIQTAGFTEENRTKKLGQEQAQSRMYGTGSIDEQIDEDAEEEEEMAEADQLSQMTQAKKHLADFKKKLSQKNASMKLKRKAAMISFPFSLGMISGGVVLLFYLITIPIALFIMLFGATGAFVSFGILKLNHAKKARADVKIPKTLRSKQAQRWYKLNANKFALAHNSSLDKDILTEKGVRMLSHAAFQQLGVFFGAALGIIIMVVLFMAMVCSIPGVGKIIC